MQHYQPFLTPITISNHPPTHSLLVSNLQPAQAHSDARNDQKRRLLRIQDGCGPWWSSQVTSDA